MLGTLHKIGEQLLEGKGIWERLTIEPKYNKAKKNWMCPILFDCIDKDIHILKDDMELYKQGQSEILYRYVKSTRKGPGQSKFDLTVERDDLSNLKESIFGKGKKKSSIQLAIENSIPELINSNFYNLFSTINYYLKDKCSLIDIRQVKEVLNSYYKDIILFVAYIRYNKNEEIQPLVNFHEFEKLVKTVFMRKEPRKGISYISGNKKEKIVRAQFWSRYNINKVFQTESLNYANNFEKKNFYKNFQGSNSDFDYLDKASKYVLKRLRVYIAEIQHVIIPSFLNIDLYKFDIKETQLFLERSSELLFKSCSLDADFEKELPETNIFWINYIAYESDGNSFKILNHIKDVNSHYLRRIIISFAKTGIDFRQYIGGKYAFNLKSVSYIIPKRAANKSKTNEALLLFKEILEQRQIDPNIIYRHFINYALCHWYGRHKAFTNIIEYDSFDYAVKDAVFKYSALIYALKQLNLLSMEKKEEGVNINQPESSKSEFQKRIDGFFRKMDYSENEKALFFLGRVLSTVAYAQYKKGHESKPVLNKVNFNGMDVQALVRLSLDLHEKARQYNLHKETDWDFSRFNERFNEKKWSLSNEQNVFYLMAGYSFGLTKSAN